MLSCSLGGVDHKNIGVMVYKYDRGEHNGVCWYAPSSIATFVFLMIS